MVRLSKCDCPAEYLVRIDRDLWMRLFQSRRHYFCAHCKSRQFLPRRAFVVAASRQQNLVDTLGQTAEGSHGRVTIR